MGSSGKQAEGSEGVTEPHHPKFRNDVPGPLPHIPPYPLQETWLPAPAQPPACWYHLTESLQALGLSFPTGAAQNTMERLGTRETVWVKLETPCPNSPPS